MFKTLMPLCFISFVSLQKITYNTTHCAQGDLIFNKTSVLPRFPPYLLSISSSTYQADKPITIEVKACRNNGFRAFLLRASIQGYVLTNISDPRTVNFGSILISCGLKNLNQNNIYHHQNDLSVLKFQWMPPNKAHGNITFHFAAVPQVSSAYWLSFSKHSTDQAEETHVTVEQMCSACTNIGSFGSWTVAMIILCWVLH